MFVRGSFGFAFDERTRDIVAAITAGPASAHEKNRCLGRSRQRSKFAIRVDRRIGAERQASIVIAGHGCVMLTPHDGDEPSGMERAMRVRTKDRLVCECGHRGSIQFAENASPFASFLQKFTVDGFAANCLTIKNVRERPGNLLEALAPICPECGEAGKVRLVP